MSAHGLPLPPGRLAELIEKIDEVRALSKLPPLGLEARGHPVAVLEEAAVSLLTEVERNRRRLIESTQLLAAISELLSDIVFSGDPEPPALTSLCHFLRGAFRLDWVHLAILDPSGQRLVGPVVRVAPGGGVRDGRLVHAWPKEGLVGRVINQHRSEILPRGEVAPATAELGATTARPLRLLACLPVGRAESSREGAGPPRPQPVRGVLAFGRSIDEELDPDHLALLESLAASVGTAIDNARLTQRLGDAIRFRDHVLESMRDGVVAVDREGRVLVMNEVAEALLVLPREQVLGRPFPEGLLLDGDLPGDPLAAARSQPLMTRRSEGWVCPPGQERRPVRLTITQLRNEQGRVYGTLITFLDLTVIREMERRIRHLDRIAALGRFTSAIAHEIRNPLAGIAAGIEYLGRGVAPADPRRSHLDFLCREVARLDRIVSDISHAARPREPERQTVRIETLAADALKIVQSRPEGAAAAIETNFAPGLPPARVDPDHLTQVFVNLLLNALQAGGSGKLKGGTGALPVVMRAWAESPPHGERVRLWVAVEDSGPGIPADNLDKIFEPFFTTKKDGTGLGLHLCHEMVKRNGGEITARNRPGGGAQFLIELPAFPPPRSKRRARQGGTSRGGGQRHDKHQRERNPS